MISTSCAARLKILGIFVRSMASLGTGSFPNFGLKSWERQSRQTVNYCQGSDHLI